MFAAVVSIERIPARRRVGNAGTATAIVGHVGEMTIILVTKV